MNKHHIIMYLTFYVLRSQIAVGLGLYINFSAWCMCFHHGPYTLIMPIVSNLKHLPGLNWILTPVSFCIFLIISPFLPITIPTANRGTGTLMPKDGNKINKAIPVTQIVKFNFKYKHPHQGCLLQLLNHTRPSVPWSLDLWWDPSPSPWLAEDKRQY